MSWMHEHLAFAALGLVLAGPPANAQTQTPDAVAQAERLRNAGDFAAAARLLRAELARRPDNGDVARLLAQTLYWLGDVAGARAVYEDALRRHPRDSTLRLQYGRMLAETGQRARAREIITRLQLLPAAQAEADALLGMLAYWDGDLTAARRLFEAALLRNPAHAEARRQLDEIRAASAPSIRAFAVRGHDDQPLDRVSVGLEAKWFATPLLPVTIRIEPSRFRLDPSTTRQVWDVEVSIAHYAPALRLETEVAGGVLRRADGPEALDWKGRAVAGLRLPGYVTLRARAERAPYLYTRASLDSRVVVDSAKGSLHWTHPRGWMGEAAYEQQRYPDGNVLSTAYAWQLVPLVHQRAAEVQAGYAFAAEDARESRFILAQPSQPFPPGDPRFDTSGRYHPYYTPDAARAHSVIAAAAFRPSPSSRLRLGGAYAVRATDLAPTFMLSAGQLQPATLPREFTPWNARASFDVEARRGVTLSATGEAGRTAFYYWFTTGLHVTYRFGLGR